MTESNETRWKRLTALLDPVHEAAARTARRLCPSSGDGDDLLQEAVLRAFDRLPALRDETRFRSWFFAVLLSVHRSRQRRSFWRRFLPLETPGEGPLPVADPGDWEGGFHGSRRAAGALQSLPAVQREAVVLFELEDFSIEEIAALQKTSVSAVKSRLSRGRDRLRRYYTRRGWSGRAARQAGPDSPEKPALTVLAAGPAPALRKGEAHD